MGEFLEDEPRWDGVDPHLVSLVDSSSFAAEQYRVLGHIVEQLHARRSLRVLAVTSAAVGDGKTTTAINLAGALAQSVEGRVLLIDADLRRASVQEQLGRSHRGHAGLVDAVLDRKLSLADVVRDDSRLRLSILHAGLGTAVPYDVLKSARLGELFEQARQQYEYVIVDTPPFVPAPDARVIAKWVDGFVMVVAAHKTPLKLMEAALDVMDPAQLMGIVFNGSNDRPFSEYYGRYYTIEGSRNGSRTTWWSRIVKPVGAALWRRHSSHPG
jgi:capsular exopolysaccharide synthesis family protein